MTQKYNKRETAFVKEYLVDLNASQAAIRAGYSVKNAGKIGPQLTQKPKIKLLIDAEMQIRGERTGLSADYVLNKIKETIERCSQAEPVMEMVDGERAPTGEWKYEHMGVLKGCELLGRHLKLFTDKIEIKDKTDYISILEQARARAKLR